MGIIRTITGDIAPENLGICLPHEHLLGRPPAPYDTQDPDLVLDDLESSLQEARDLRGTGVDSLVEMTPIDYHRDPAGLRTISEKSRLQIICATGYLKDKFCTPFVSQMTIDQLAEQFITEIQVGIGETDIRAGVIKAASSLNTITDNERKVFQAAAIAQQETGALISTHTEAGTMAREQIERLTSAGVAPDRILIGHLDRNMDWEYHQQVADTGVYFGYDQISKVKYYPDELRVEFICRMIEAGHGAQLMLSTDIARRSEFGAYGGSPGHSVFMQNFVPMLHESGLSAGTINILIRDNPKNALTLSS